MIRVGFVINSRLPSVAMLRFGMRPHNLLTGWDDAASPMSVMRFRWIAEIVNRRKDVRYELYKPWRRYDAYVMVKSMAHHCVAFARDAKIAGRRVIFDANVDYYTPPPETGVSPEMVPSERQRQQAFEITRMADGVMASSRHLAEVCSLHSASPAEWIPDNVNFSLIPTWKKEAVSASAPLSLWWSGMPQKLFEFLAIEKVLRKYAGRLHLHLVTTSLKAMEVWPEEVRARFKALLRDIPHTLHPFRSVTELLGLYARGNGIIVSPRFLETPYNFGHSEWKLTLGMACGLPALCSPVPSYEDVAARTDADAIRICPAEDGWDAAIAAALDGSWNLVTAGRTASDVVRKFYGTEVVAQRHFEFVTQSLF